MLTKLQKGDTSSVIYSEYDEQFQAVGILVILLLIIEICILEVKNPLLRNVMFFGKAFSMGRAAKSSQLGKTSILLLLLIVNCGLAFAQNDRTFIRQGNKLYRSQKWAQAETQYRKAISKNAKNTQALYNLGCALMMQQKDSMAMVQYQHAAQEETNVLRRSKSYHNMGVIMQNHREYAKAIECYKMALRCNPQDNETRYNLALCKKLLKNQPQKNNKDNKNNKNKNNKNKNKDQNNKDKNNEQDKNNKKNNDKDKNKQNQNEERNQDKMSKDNAEQLLNAAIQQEKATKQKMQKALSQPKSRSYEKNW
jgi:tetratricopeptide (TPR) repeat protein